MAIVLVAVGLVSSGFLVGLTIARPWSLAVLPTLVAGFVFLADPMQLVANLALIVLCGGAAFGGTWSGLAMHRRVQRSPSR